MSRAAAARERGKAAAARGRKTPASRGVRGVEPYSADEVYDLLAERYGKPERRARLDGVSELVWTILSQHTSDLNAERAFAALSDRYPTWESAMSAPEADLVETIRGGGLARQKAPRIQQALRSVRDRAGGFDIGFLAHLPLEEAKAWLREIPGVGPKTAGVVLSFAMDQPAMAVDTHVHRVAKRLALIGPKVTADAAHDVLERAVAPERDAASAHLSHHARAPRLQGATSALRRLHARGALPGGAAPHQRGRYARPDGVAEPQAAMSDAKSPTQLRLPESPPATPEETREAARLLLLELARKHRITPAPRLEWSGRMRRLLGRAYLDRNLIRLSIWLDGEQAMETLRHELAHIAAGRVRQPHGDKWKRWAERLGANPRATSHRAPEFAPPPSPDRRAVGLECPGCGLRIVRLRAQRNLYCRACGPKRGMLSPAARGPMALVREWAEEKKG